MTRLAILGCGAITRIRHIKSALVHPRVKLSALVDADIQRAINLQEKYGLKCQVASSHREIMANVDAVINALPNHLHAPINLEVLEAGIHVLSEKPLAVSADEARACAEAADRHGVTLAVGMPWRFRHSSQILPLILESGELGKLLGYTWDYGMPFDWPTASDYFLSRKLAGGGVLLDEGVHMLDCLLSWFGDAVECDCQSDDWGGGVEANVILRLCHRSDFGEIEGRVRLSRTYTLRNSLTVEGERAFAEITRSNPDCVLVTRRIGDRRVQSAFTFPSEGCSGPVDPFVVELDDFVQAIEKKCAPVVDGWQALRTIELIERCYENASRISEPWEAVECQGAMV